ncbi:unnamed protein product [Amoebophrya sp. A25]|nr:unnamed protein product [Amoebophrya sp. A25]|eukprot:GSA25T00007079001.1
MREAFRKMKSKMGFLVLVGPTADEAAPLLADGETILVKTATLEAKLPRQEQSVFARLRRGVRGTRHSKSSLDKLGAFMLDMLPLGIQRVFFLDADILPLANMDHLFSIGVTKIEHLHQDHPIQEPMRTYAGMAATDMQGINPCHVIMCSCAMLIIPSETLRLAVLAEANRTLQHALTQQYVTYLRRVDEEEPEPAKGGGSFNSGPLVSLKALPLVDEETSRTAPSTEKSPKNLKRTPASFVRQALEFEKSLVVSEVETDTNRKTRRARQSHLLERSRGFAFDILPSTGTDQGMLNRLATTCGIPATWPASGARLDGSVSLHSNELDWHHGERAREYTDEWYDHASSSSNSSTSTKQLSTLLWAPAATKTPPATSEDDTSSTTLPLLQNFFANTTSHGSLEMVHGFTTTSTSREQNSKTQDEKPEEVMNLYTYENLFLTVAEVEKNSTTTASRSTAPSSTSTTTSSGVAASLERPQHLIKRAALSVHYIRKPWCLHADGDTMEDFKRSRWGSVLSLTELLSYWRYYEHNTGAELRALTRMHELTEEEQKSMYSPLLSGGATQEQEGALLRYEFSQTSQSQTSRSPLEKEKYPIVDLPSAWMLCGKMLGNLERCKKPDCFYCNSQAIPHHALCLL